MDKKIELFQWTWSALIGNTAFFYFKQQGSYDLLMVEYWADEDKVADYAQYCSEDGDIVEDEGRYLTDDEKAYFLEVCRAATAKK